MSLSLHTVARDRMTRAQSAAVIELCSAVFGIDYGFYMAFLCDRVHVLAYDGRRLVSHALWLSRRLRIGSGPWLFTAYVEGVATHPACRGLGYGSAVMRRVQAETAGCDVVVLSPAQPEWYERLGWERWQGPLSVELPGGAVLPTPGECLLIQRTPRTGALDLTLPLTAEWRPWEPW